MRGVFFACYTFFMAVDVVKYQGFMRVVLRLMGWMAQRGWKSA